MERSIDRVRDLGSAYFELGRLYLALYLRDHAQAHRHLTPTGVVGDLKSARSRVEQADLAFAEAKRRQPDLPAWQAQYAEAVKRLAEQDFEGCAAACDAIVAEEPDLEEVWKLKGDALRRLGEDPLPCYARALEIRRSFYDALLVTAEVQLERGERDAARASASHALEIHPGLVPAQVLMARSARSAGEGLEWAERARAANPGHYDAAVTLAELQMELGETDRALEILAEAKELMGCQNRVSLLTGRALLQRGDVEEVRALCRKQIAREESAPWRELLAAAESRDA